MRNNLSILLLAGALVLILGVLFRPTSGIKINQQTGGSISPIPGSNEFKASGVLDFSVQVPSRYTVSEKTLSVEFMSSEGKISVNKSASGYNNIEDYVKSLLEKNKTDIVDEKSLKINGLPAIRGFINNNLAYFIYAEGSVYSIGADSESVFHDLDQIAQSFRYTP